MNELKIFELNKVDSLIIKCVRSWVKSVVFRQNPIPQIINYLINYGRVEAVIPFDDLMTSISLSSVKIYDFRKFNSDVIGETEKEILKILYLIQCKNTDLAHNYVKNLVDRRYIKATFDNATFIAENFSSGKMFFYNPLLYLTMKNDTNIINYDFVNKKYVKTGVS
tara:strand:+ start:94 stop:591 length:498 start_codon:yes stop_codon:yes gene_type:complete